jgi:hypothetical protein
MIGHVLPFTIQAFELLNHDCDDSELAGPRQRVL